MLLLNSMQGKNEHKNQFQAVTWNIKHTQNQSIKPDMGPPRYMLDTSKQKYKTKSVTQNL